jgi:hypothetical protein
MSPRLAFAKPLTASGVNSPGKRGKKKGDPTRVAFLFVRINRCCLVSSRFGFETYMTILNIN